MEYNELIKTRQSCRNFEGEKRVSKEDITVILESASLAPSACNAQPYHFYVADKAEDANEIAKLTQSMGMNKFTSEVPVFVVVCEGAYNKTALVGSKVKDQDYRSVDIGLAVSQMCLCATTLGLSTCILGWFDEKKVQQKLDTKARVRLIIALGYAKAGDKIREKSRKNMSDIVTYL